MVKTYQPSSFVSRNHSVKAPGTKMGGKMALVRSGRLIHSSVEVAGQVAIASLFVAIGDVSSPAKQVFLGQQIGKKKGLFPVGLRASFRAAFSGHKFWLIIVSGTDIVTVGVGGAKKYETLQAPVC